MEIVGEAANAAEAIALAQAHDVDVVFLDVEMPGLTGIEAAGLVRDRVRPAAVVFVTAHAEYAADAFAVEAFDYVLKPVDPERLARVVDRIATIHRPLRDARKVPVVGSGGTELLAQEQICYVQAEGDYSRVHTFDRSYLSTSSLRELEESLPRERFLRIHRSYLVNLAKIASLRRAGPDRLRLTLDDAARTELDVARRQAARVSSLLKLG
jgi:DNA-binding LytR/AlgR family response regulator